MLGREGKRKKEEKEEKEEEKSGASGKTRRGPWNAITLIVIAQRVRRIELGIGATKRAVEEGGGRKKGNERDWLVFVIPRAEESSRGRVHATIMGWSWRSYSPHPWKETSSDTES